MKIEITTEMGPNAIICNCTFAGSHLPLDPLIYHGSNKKTLQSVDWLFLRKSLKISTNEMTDPGTSLHLHLHQWMMNAYTAAIHLSAQKSSTELPHLTSLNCFDSALHIHAPVMLWASSFHLETFPCILVSLARQHVWAKILPTGEEGSNCKLERGGWMSLDVPALTESPRPVPHLASKAFFMQRAAAGATLCAIEDKLNTEQLSYAEAEGLRFWGPAANVSARKYLPYAHLLLLLCN